MDPSEVWSAIKCRVAKFSSQSAIQTQLAIQTTMYYSWPYVEGINNATFDAQTNVNDSQM